MILDPHPILSSICDKEIWKIPHPPAASTLTSAAIGVAGGYSCNAMPKFLKSLRNTAPAPLPLLAIDIRRRQNVAGRSILTANLEQSEFLGASHEMQCCNRLGDYGRCNSSTSVTGDGAEWDSP
jgi:hypothetical protein